MSLQLYQASSSGHVHSPAPESHPSGKAKPTRFAHTVCMGRLVLEEESLEASLLEGQSFLGEHLCPAVLASSGLTTECE